MAYLKQLLASLLPLPIEAIEVFVFVVGFFLLVKGADYLVDYSVFIAKRFGLPPIFVGIAILSVGTSLPEFSTSFYAIATRPISNATSFVVGNVLGSNISNLGLVFGSALLFSHLQKTTSLYRSHLPFNFFALALFFLLAFNLYLPSSWHSLWYADFAIGRFDAVLFVVGLVVYLLNNYRKQPLVAVASEETKQTLDDKNSAENDDALNSFRGFMFFLASLVAIYLGSQSIVDGAFFIAVDLLGVDEKLIVLTLVAFGTSLPELATSISTLRKGQESLFLGNVMGSNMFNIFFVVGLSALFKPLKFKNENFLGSFAFDFFWFFLFLVLLTLCIKLQKQRLSRKTGVALMVLYVLFVVYLVALT